MRLWSLDFGYLDRQGLLAVWREALLAKKVLQGKTLGYRNHPQLARFREQKSPAAAINSYLKNVFEESCKRNYCFDRKKIGRVFSGKKIPVTRGQLSHEFVWLKSKLRKRCPAKCRGLLAVKFPKPNKLFFVVPGKTEAWEKV